MSHIHLLFIELKWFFN